MNVSRMGLFSLLRVVHSLRPDISRQYLLVQVYSLVLETADPSWVIADDLAKRAIKREAMPWEE
jgi:hypothetical protein